MGLASKLAASAGPVAAAALSGTQGGFGGAPPIPSQRPTGATGGYPGQQQQQQQYGASQYQGAPGGYPGQQGQQGHGQNSYGAPQGQYPGQYGGSSQGQYGGQQQYGGGANSQQYGNQQYAAPNQQYGQQPPPIAGGDQNSFRAQLEEAVRQKHLERFYPPGSPQINQVAAAAVDAIPRICREWHLQPEIGRDLARLGLYDIIIFVDDSGSMQFEEQGERIQDLRLILERVAFAATLFDPDGISIRFMNTVLPGGAGDHIRNAQGVNDLMANVRYQGLTPMGREMKRKVIDGIVLRDARQGGLRKPVLVIAITDGQPAGDDSPDAIFDTVRYATSEVSRATGTNNALSFQFAQVGNDKKAREFLGRLDVDPSLGDAVDVTSNYEQEQAEMLHQVPPVELTPDMWFVKLLLGSIDPAYDSKDEVRSYRPGGGQPLRPQQGYGGGPPAGGQYPPPAGSHGHPQQQQGYGGQGQYGGQQQQQYGQPQYPQQGGGYSGGGGGYGAPPPPRY